MTSTSRPLFSAVIPVHNGEKYLATAIQNVLDLPYQPMELIVVNDGSTDSTEKIIGNFSHPIRYLHQPNRGPAAARNLGLKFSQGEVIAFLDADDLWTPSIVTRALALLIARPDVAVVQGRVQEITDQPNDASGTAYQHRLEPYSFINIGSAVYRKEIFATVGGFDESMRFCEDYDWFLRAFDAGIYKVRIDDVTLLYRAHCGGMTYGKTVHEIGMAKAHKKAIQRRREDPIQRRAAAGFPTLAEYIGTRPAPRPQPREKQN